MNNEQLLEFKCHLHISITKILIFSLHACYFLYKDTSSYNKNRILFCSGAVLRWGRGQFPKCDMKHWHIGAKKEHSVAFKICQHAFPGGGPPWTPLWELSTLPRPLVSWGGTPSPMPTPGGTESSPGAQEIPYWCSRGGHVFWGCERGWQAQGWKCRGHSWERGHGATSHRVSILS